ncbi:MAG: alcohol dehydrogenase catalytic domain-containing protein, partial [Tepidisphaeraceae bacterium]
SGLRTGVKAQIMGHELSGSVVRVHRSVTKYSLGQRVAIAPDVSWGECHYCRRSWVNLCANHRMIGTHWPGGFAQYIHLPAEVLSHGMVHLMPPGLSYEQAALAEPASSVLAAQQNAGIGPGDTVAIFGDGPVGCLHLDIARLRGASQILMVGLRRLAQARAFAPNALIDAASQDPVAEIRKLTNGLGADVVIVATPVAATQALGVEAVRKRGTVILFGGLPESSPTATLNTNLIHYNEIRLVGAFSYPAYMHEQALLVINEGKIDSDKYFTRTVSLAEIPVGIKAAEAGAALKVLVKPWS